MTPKEVNRHCASCGMLVDRVGEFHPYAFCVWKRAGMDPWETLRWIENQLGRTPLSAKPPLVRHLTPFSEHPKVKVA